jgi:cyclopropane fatty-acyl-phospholipid synthase-like methyltransferase
MQPPHSLSDQSFFPRSARYDREWVVRNSIGENVLYNLESLTEVLRIEPGMRVLDLACGKAVSSIFMAREFDVQVWAVDSAVSATDNYRRICENACENKVFPLPADARRLPFPKGFFDLVVIIDSYTYFGTDDKYLPYLCKFLKPTARSGSWTCVSGRRSKPSSRCRPSCGPTTSRTGTSCTPSTGGKSGGRKRGWCA